MLVKLTTKAGKSKHGNVSWKVGKTVSIPKKQRGMQMCEPGMLHVYEGNVALALMLDPYHANIGAEVRAFQVSGKIVQRDRQMKVAGHSFKVVRELCVPKITTEQRIVFALMCAFEAAAYAAAYAAADAVAAADAADAAAAAAYAAYAAAYAAADAEPRLLAYLAEQALTF